VLALLFVAAGLTVACGTALADLMSLSIAPEPVEELTSQIAWNSGSEGGVFAIVAVNNPGVQCAATPQGDFGRVVIPTHLSPVRRHWWVLRRSELQAALNRILDLRLAHHSHGSS
jgi:hypothetical protein